jgi:hypothetical protein
MQGINYLSIHQGLKTCEEEGLWTSSTTTYWTSQIITEHSEKKNSKKLNLSQVNQNMGIAYAIQAVSEKTSPGL